MNRKLGIALSTVGTLAAMVLSLFAPPGHGRPDASPRAITPRGPLLAEEQSHIEVFKRTSPSVVHITSLAAQRDLFSLRVQQVPSGTGTGFIWDATGHIVTNFHVIQSAQRAKARPHMRFSTDGSNNRLLVPCIWF